MAIKTTVLLQITIERPDGAELTAAEVERIRKAAGRAGAVEAALVLRDREAARGHNGRNGARKETS